MKLKKIAEFLGGKLVGNGEIEIYRVASVQDSEKGDITFIENRESIPDSTNINASCIIVSNDFSIETSNNLIRVNNPKLAFAKIAEVLHPPKIRETIIHKSAVIADNARLEKDIFIGAFCCVGEKSEIGEGTQLRAGAKVGDNVKIGKNCVLHPNVFIEDNSEIGDSVILHSGVVIGGDGYGYVRDTERHVKFPQIGKVIIENNVEIGANTCVDRGALGNTKIGEGTKIDNLVQIAHNVKIGKRVVIASQTGISGSVTIEDDCVIAGQVGFADHTVIKKGAIIGAKSAVFPGKIVREGMWAGIPVQPMNKYKRLNAHINSIPRIKEDLKKLQKLIDELENK